MTLQWRRRLAWTMLGLLGSGLPTTSRGDDRHADERPDHSFNARTPAVLIYPNPGETSGDHRSFREPRAIPVPAAGGQAETLRVWMAGERLPNLAGLELVPGYSARIGTGMEPQAAAAQAARGQLAPGQARGDLVVRQFSLRFGGIPLSPWSSRSVFLQGDGAVLATRSRFIPEKFGEVEPTNKAQDAIEAALKDSRTAFQALYDLKEAGPDELVVEAQGRDEAFPRAFSIRGELGWPFIVKSSVAERPFRRRYLVSARGEPSFLEREDLIFFAQSGQVTGTVWGFNQTPFDPLKRDEGLRHLRVTWFGSGTGQTTLTDDQGRFQFPNARGDATLRADLFGPFCQIMNQAGRNLVLTQPVMGEGRPSVLNFDVSNQFDVAQVSAFRWVNEAHDFVFRDELAGTPLVKLKEVATHVNLNQYCNSQWSGSLFLYRAAPAGSVRPCPNMSYASVIFHEYGHGVDDEFGRIHAADYSEGFGDSLSILITHDPVVGRDFFGRGRNLRDPSNEVVLYPSIFNRNDPRNGDPHYRGEVYGGFVWELTRQLLLQYHDDEKEAYRHARTLVLGAAAMDPATMRQAVRYSLYLDYQAGSSSREALEKAAASRQIPIPKDYGDLNSPYLGPQGEPLTDDPDTPDLSPATR